MPIDPNQDPSIQTGANLPTPPDTGAIAAQPQIDPGQPPQPGTPAPDKHSAFGRFARSLFTGTDTSYQYDDSGKLVETETKQKPGSLFRHMLAGALLGGAMGAEDPSHTFAGGFVRGGAGVQMDQRKQDEIRRQQAKEAYEMRLKGVQSGREGEKLEMEKQKLELEKREQDNKDVLAKAQTTMYNSEVLRNNTISQGASLEQHMKAKMFFAPEVDTFKAMGLDPSQDRVSEEEMANVWSKRPDAGGLTWVVSDVKMGSDEKGNPTYQYLYSGYDLKKDVPVSAQTLKLWKESGLAQTHPEIFKYKPDTVIPANNYKAWNQQALANMNQKLEMDKSNVDIAFKQQQIAESKARAAKDFADMGKQNKELRKEEHFEQAMNDLVTSGYDISKVKPENRGVIGQYAGQMLRDLGPSYAAATRIGETTGDWSQSQRIGQQMADFQNLMSGTVTKPQAQQDAEFAPKPGEDSSLTSPAGMKALSTVMQKKGIRDPKTAAIYLLGIGWTNPHAAGGAQPSDIEPAHAGEEITGKDLLKAGGSLLSAPANLFKKGMETISGR